MNDRPIPPNSGWMREPLVPLVRSPTPNYSSTTDERVRVFDVRDDDRLLGYLWASHDDEAAAFLPHESSGDDAYNASIAWRLALRGAKARGLGALAALDDVMATGGPAHAGTIVVSSRRDLPSLVELRALARS